MSACYGTTSSLHHNFCCLLPNLRVISSQCQGFSTYHHSAFSLFIVKIFTAYHHFLYCHFLYLVPLSFITTRFVTTVFLSIHIHSLSPLFATLVSCYSLFSTTHSCRAQGVTSAFPVVLIVSFLIVLMQDEAHKLKQLEVQILCFCLT